MELSFQSGLKYSAPSSPEILEHENLAISCNGGLIFQDGNMCVNVTPTLPSAYRSASISDLMCLRQMDDDESTLVCCSYGAPYGVVVCQSQIGRFVNLRNPSEREKLKMCYFLSSLHADTVWEVLPLPMRATGGLRLVVSCGGDRTLRLWNLDLESELVFTTPEGYCRRYDRSVAHLDSSLVSAGDEGILRWWDYERVGSRFSLVESSPGIGGVVYSLASDEMRQVVCSGGEQGLASGVVSLWSPLSRGPVLRSSVILSKVDQVLVVPHANLIVVSTIGGVVAILDPRASLASINTFNRCRIPEAKRYKRRVKDLAVVGTDHVASVWRDGTVQVWNRETLKIRSEFVFKRHCFGVRCLDDPLFDDHRSQLEERIGFLDSSLLLIVEIGELSLRCSPSFVVLVENGSE